MIKQELLTTRWFFQGVVVTVTYYISGRLGQAIPSIGHITLIWLPTGIAVAALLRWGRSLWPAVYLGAFLVSLHIAASLPLAAGIAVGNTLAPWLTASLLHRLNFHQEFDHKLDVVWLVLAAMAGMLVSAIHGATLLWWHGILPSQEFGRALATWWMGDTVGVLLAAPLLITLSKKNCGFLRTQSIEVIIVTFILLSLNWFVFLSPYNLTLAYIPVLVVMWAAMRFGIVGASIAVLIDAVLSAWGTALGHGPFYLNGQLDLLILWIYIVTHTIVSLVITALQAERNHSEAQKQTVLDHLTKIASRLPGVIYQFRLTPDGHASVPYASEAIRTLYDLDPAILKKDAMPVLQRTHPDDYHNLMTSIQESARTLTPWQHEFRIRHTNGTERWLFGDSVPEREADGATLWHGFITDISAQKEAQFEMARAKTEAESANQAKTDFLSAMSHEMRTPMNIILGMSDVLFETPLNYQQKHYIMMLKNTGNNLLQIINDILDLSKIEANKLSILTEPVAIRQEAQEVIDLFKVMANQKGLSLELKIAPSLPEWILSDPLRLRQCLFNLISNSLKFTERGWIVVEIGSDDHQPPNLRCVVSDSGIGIHPDHLTRIFESFSQSDSGISRRYGGTGLGLSLTKRLLEMMGGTLDVTSQLGQGSQFSFTLPLRTTNAPQTEHTPDTPSLMPQENIPLRILLVEDVQENRILISLYLKNTLHQISMAHDGMEGVQRVKEEAFDLVLMDIEMPVLNGLQATAMIREWEREIQRHPPLFIVALSAHSMTNDINQCFASGCNEHLSKPINKQTLLATLHRYGVQLQPDQTSISTGTT